MKIEFWNEIKEMNKISKKIKKKEIITLKLKFRITLIVYYFYKLKKYSIFKDCFQNNYSKDWLKIQKHSWKLKKIY